MDTHTAIGTGEQRDTETGSPTATGTDTDAIIQTGSENELETKGHRERHLEERIDGDGQREGER